MYSHLVMHVTFTNKTHKKYMRKLTQRMNDEKAIHSILDDIEKFEYYQNHFSLYIKEILIRVISPESSIAYRVKYFE